LTELKEWEGALSLIANLTAVSIQHHRAVKSKLASLEAVQLASDEISRIRLGTNRREVLDKIVEQAVACLPQASMGTIQLYDEERNELRFESVYSHEEDARLLELVGERRPLVRRPRRKGNKGRIGIAGRTVLEKAPQLVVDVTLDPDYFEFSPETKSELSVPLLTDDNTVLGVLNVESKRLAAFSNDDEQALLALAKLVVATIQNAEQYTLLENEEQFRLLKETQSQVASLTTLAWLGMASNTWGHSVAGCALDIRGNLKLLRMDLKEHALKPELEKLLEDKITFIDEMAEQILEKPITALLLSYDVAPSDVSINGLISERVRHLWGDPRYEAVRYKLNLTEQEPRVRCSPDWISRMLDILIDNAVDATEGMADRSLMIGTRIVGNQVEIAFTDTGPGVPQDIKHKLFRQRIDKSADSKGLGVGLLIAQAIAQTYRGGARVGRTGPKGTTMIVRLPVVEHE
jgi:signal transduction histidine kinase